MNDSIKKWYLVQWHKTDENRVRLVNKALYNGYFIAERLLEDCMFVVTVTADGELSVEADSDSSKYIQGSLKASVSEWNKEVLDDLEEHGADNLDSYATEEDWLDSEVCLTSSLDFYTKNGILVEPFHSYDE